MRGLKLSQWLIVAVLALVVVGVWVTALGLILFLRPSPVSPVETPTTVPSGTPPAPSPPLPPPATSPPVPPTATPTSTAPVTITDWRGEYFADRAPQGAPRVVRNDKAVDFHLPYGTAPAPNMPSENWSARWRRNWRFEEGNYRFRLVVDDGARLRVEDRLLIDAGADGSQR